MIIFPCSVVFRASHQTAIVRATMLMLKIKQRALKLGLHPGVFFRLYVAARIKRFKPFLAPQELKPGDELGFSE